MPQINETVSKKYYHIGEVAAMTNQSASAIRFYEEYLFITIQKKNQRGERFFTLEEAKLMGWISKASKVYKLHIIKIALKLFPDSRFHNTELLRNEELTRIIDYEIRTPRRSNINKARSPRG